MTEILKSPETIRDELSVDGYSSLASVITKKNANELYSQFNSFVALTQETGGDELVDAVSYKVDDTRIGSYGLELSKPGETNVDGHEIIDHKYLYHFGPQTRQRAEDKLGGALPQEMDDFLLACETFYDEGTRIGRIGATALGISDLLFGKNGRESDLHALRILDYISGEQGELAEAHFDTSVLTVTLNESHKGLMGTPADNGFPAGLNSDKKLEIIEGMQPIKQQVKRAKLFCGAGLRRLPMTYRQQNDLDNIPLLAHGVNNEVPGTNRQAVVFFMNPSENTIPRHPAPELLPEDSRRSNIFYFVPESTETKIRLD